MGETTNEITDEIDDPVSEPMTSDDPEEIRAHIEKTRAEMSDTIQELQDRLNPEQLKEQAKEEIEEQIDAAKESIKEATIGKAEAFMHNVGDKISEVASPLTTPLTEGVSQAKNIAGNLANHSGERVRGTGQQQSYGSSSSSSSLLDTIRENPVPAALVAFGIGWLLLGPKSNQSSQSTNRNGSRYSNLSDAAKPLSKASHAVGDTVNDAMETAQEKAGELSDMAQHKASQAQDTFQRTLRDSPLSIGIIALAVGTAIGLSLPSTKPEQQLMGETHEKLMDKASEFAHDTVEKVQSVAGKVVEEAKKTAVNEAKEQGLTSSFTSNSE